MAPKTCWLTQIKEPGVVRVRPRWRRAVVRADGCGSRNVAIARDASAHSAMIRRVHEIDALERLLRVVAQRHRPGTAPPSVDERGPLVVVRKSFANAFLRVFGSVLGVTLRLFDLALDLIGSALSPQGFVVGRFADLFLNLALDLIPLAFGAIFRAFGHLCLLWTFPSQLGPAVSGNPSLC